MNELPPDAKYILMPIEIERLKARWQAEALREASWADITEIHSVAEMRDMLRARAAALTERVGDTNT